MPADLFTGSERSQHLLALALRGELPPSGVARAIPAPEILEAAEGHGIGPLLHDHIERVQAWASWPDGLEALLSQRAILSALVAERRRREIATVLASLRGAGVETLLMKGVPLAYTHYPRPGLRPCIDTDLFFPERCREAFERVVLALGYEWLSVGTAQAAYRKRDASGTWHMLDAHWGLSGFTVARRDFTFEELAARSVAVPELGEAARALGAVDALLLCGIHFAHHLGRERLVWLYDVQLLTRSLDDESLRLFERLARRKGVRAVSARILEFSEDRLGRVLPEGTLERLRPGPAWLARLREPSAAFLPGARPLLYESLAVLRNLEGSERRRFATSLVIGSTPRGAASGRLSNLARVVRRVAKGVVRYLIMGRQVNRGRHRFRT